MLRQRKKASVYITQAAVIAALYAALTYLASVFGIAYGNVQFRFSEALTVLAVFTPAAIPGLTIGCFIGNLLWLKLRKLHIEIRRDSLCHIATSR